MSLQNVVNICGFARLRMKQCVKTQGFAQLYRKMLNTQGFDAFLVRSRQKPSKKRYGTKKVQTHEENQKKTMFHRLLGELGPPAHPGVSETMLFFIFGICLFFSMFFAFVGSVFAFTRFWATAQQKCVNTRGVARLRIENLANIYMEPK